MSNPISFRSPFLERVVQELTGLTPESIMDKPLSEVYLEAQSRYHEPMKVTGVVNKIVYVLGEKIRIIQ